MDLIKFNYYLRPFLYSIMDFYAAFAAMPRGYAILSYHQISASCTEDLMLSSMKVDVGSFAHQMQMIKSQAQPVSLLEMVNRIKGGIKADGLYVAVTFDDGYANNLLLAYPILKELNIPATLFISTAYVDNPSLIPWWDELHHLVKKLTGTIKIEFNGIKLNFDMNIPNGKRTLIAKLSNFMTNGTALEKENILSLLRCRVFNYSKPDRNAFADWTQLKQVVDEGLISVGGHTVTHANLTECVDFGIKEIDEGKARLEEVLGFPISLFAYPFGAFNNDIIGAVRYADFLAAVTCAIGINQAADDVFSLKRIPIAYNRNQNHFLTRLKFAGNGLLVSLFNKVW
ncbi:MAG: polysaccharide deacetylase family protein [Candidatus Helarchaeota archaeon]|nr:polysaccharide deacetylase family protein [Candidatus Helarchaeota archaeon]